MRRFGVRWMLAPSIWHEGDWTMRKAVATVAVVCGLGLVVLPFGLSLFDRAPAGERVTNRFRSTLSANGLHDLAANFEASLSPSALAPTRRGGPCPDGRALAPGPHDVSSPRSSPACGALELIPGSPWEQTVAR
jgi:hypothetical protein